MGVGVGKKSPENPRIGVRPSELGAWGYGERFGLVRDLYFGSHGLVFQDQDVITMGDGSSACGWLIITQHKDFVA